MLRIACFSLALLVAAACPYSDRSDVVRGNAMHQEIGLVGMDYVLSFDLPDASWKLSDLPAPQPAGGLVYASGERKLSVRAISGKTFDDVKQLAYDVSAAAEARAGMTDEGAKIDAFDERIRIELPDPRMTIVSYPLAEWPNVRAIVVYVRPLDDSSSSPIETVIGTLRLIRR